MDPDEPLWRTWRENLTATDYLAERNVGGMLADLRDHGSESADAMLARIVTQVICDVPHDEIAAWWRRVAGMLESAGRGDWPPDEHSDERVIAFAGCLALKLCGRRIDVLRREGGA